MIFCIVPKSNIFEILSVH